MTIKESSNIQKPEIDLNGPEGNAYALLNYAKNYSKQLELNYEEISDKMKSGDYENLIEVFDSYFGDYIDLVR